LSSSSENSLDSRHKRQPGKSGRKREVNASFKHSYGRDPRWLRALGRVAAVVVIAVVIVLVARQWFYFDGSAQSYYQRALDKFENRDYPSAVIDLRNALEQEPGYSKARKLLSKTYLMMNQAAKARQELALAKELGISEAYVDASVRYEDAVVRFNRGEFQGAIIQLRKVLEMNPDDIVAFLLLGRAYLGIGDGYSAEVMLRRARSGGTADALVVVPLARAYLLQKKYKLLFNEISSSNFAAEVMGQLNIIAGLAYLTRNEYDQAEQAYARAATFLPASTAPLIGRARVKLRQGDFEQAQALANTAQSLSPDAGDVWNLQAEIQRYQRNLEQALAFYNKALELEPNQADSRRGRAAALLDLNRSDEALEALQQVYETTPTDIHTAYLYSLALAQSDQMEQARTVLTNTGTFIDSLDPLFVQNDPSTLLISGLINYSADKLEVANLNLERFVKLRPNHFGGRQLYAAILLRRGEARRAIEILVPVQKAVNNDPQALVILGNAYNQEKQYSQAIKMFERAVELAPDQIKLRASLALSRLASGRKEEAIGGLKSGLEKNPDAAGISMLLGLVYLKQGRFSEALATAQALIKRQPENAFTYNLAGSAELGLGNSKAARAQFVRSIEVSPEFVPGRINLARLNLRQGNLDAARSSLIGVVEAQANEVTALLLLASIDQRLNHLDRALEWLLQARKAERDNVVVGLRLVSFYIGVDKPKQALTAAQDLEAQYPNNLPVLASLSRVQFALGNRQAAGDILQNMIKLASGQPRSLQRIALQQMKFGAIDDAEQTLGMALKLDANFIPAQSALIEIAMQRQRYQEALNLARRLQASQPDAAAGNVLTGNILFQMRRFSDAARSYEKAFDKQPSAALLIRVYEAYRSAGNPATALPSLEAWLTSNPDDVMVRRALAAAYLDVGQLPKAIELHETLLVDIVDDAALINNLAGLYQKTGDSRALAYAEKAYALAPEQPATLDTLGWVLAEKGESIRALKYLRQAQNRLPDNLQVGYHIAVALEQLGRTEAARQELQRVLNKGEDFDGVEDARELLSRLAND